ncbi:hypothetical protein BN159_0134 [Streptomyces davaonensis JCM 4913]|uniref:Tn3 transposase DDE domain-containing protein n=1 Tax=Streptomyces davaonensis (strain DSM 101723 / JCM 4913 / KCC S-0913 / 768) TaxID=1214101 RepID=K4QUA0_STRDJ|nr:Tn3 family transposase [Streptomyces davaonensis]CCK24513.1 hypothetical protein BN159_0134 [Streptomyces davaonensis JCM 4913]
MQLVPDTCLVPGRQAPPAGQLGALGLVLDAMVLWATRYINAAVARLRAEGHEIRDGGIARLSPLKHENLTVLGRCGFTASVAAGGSLRPLRGPDAVGLDGDDESADEWAELCVGMGRRYRWLCLERGGAGLAGQGVRGEIT